jgi:hypothetical protein
MEEQTRKDILDVCREAYKKQHDGELKYFKDMAYHIKKTLDVKIPGAWHIVVGKFILLHIFFNRFEF